MTKGEYWIRCRPSDVEGDTKPLPRLALPGAARFTTQPDGMWAYLRGLTCADVLAVEVCGSMQNLNDKRARFMPTGTGLMLVVPSAWFKRPMRVQGGVYKPRAEATGCLRESEIPAKGDTQVPVRFLRVLFVIPDDQYRTWMASHVPAGHEYFMKHSSLRSGTSQKAQAFLVGMSFSSHFYTQR